MENARIRMVNIAFSNIKNVANGSISLNEVKENNFGASIVGIYGQNGSGKTALISAIELVKEVISGESLEDDTYFYIRQESQAATIKVEWLMNFGDRDYNVNYTLKIGKKDNEKVQILSESVDYSSKAYNEFSRINKSKIIGIEYPSLVSDINKCFYIPDSRVAEMASKDKQIKQRLTIVQALANEKTMSFIFNEKAMPLFEQNFENPIYYKILNALMY